MWHGNNGNHESFQRTIVQEIDWFRPSSRRPERSEDICYCCRSVDFLCPYSNCDWRGDKTFFLLLMSYVVHCFTIRNLWNELNCECFHLWNETYQVQKSLRKYSFENTSLQQTYKLRVSGASSKIFCL